jgi:anti-sigma B factor antagonist
MDPATRGETVPPYFGCAFGRDGARAVVRLRGEIDMISASQLWPLVRDLVADQELLDVEIDLRDVSFLDSTGIKLLIDTDRIVHDHGGQLLLMGPSGLVLRLFDMLGLREHFVIET